MAACPKCGAELSSDARFCRKCGAPVEGSGHSGPQPVEDGPPGSMQALQPEAKSGARYPALHLYVPIMKAAAWVGGLAYLIGGIVIGSSIGNSLGGLGGSAIGGTITTLSVLVSVVLGFIIWLGITVVAEGVQVIMDIEANTRASATSPPGASTP